MTVWPPREWNRTERVLVVAAFVSLLMLGTAIGWPYWRHTERERLVDDIRSLDATVEPRYPQRLITGSRNWWPETPNFYTVTVIDTTEEQLREIVILTNQLPVSISLNIEDSPELELLDFPEIELKFNQLILQNNSNLKDVESVANATNLRSLKIKNCPVETEWKFLNSLTNLQTLVIENSGEIKSDQYFKQLTMLSFLAIDCDMRLTDLDFLRHMPLLTVLETGISVDQKIKANRTVAKLNNIDGLAHCPKLYLLNLAGCEMDATVPDLDKMSQLKFVEMGGVQQQESLDFLKDGQRYVSVKLTDFTGLTDISRLKNCSLEGHLDLQGATNLSDITVLIENPAILKPLKGGLDLRGTSVPEEQIEQLRLVHPNLIISSDFIKKK
ncbi:hypothetical protein Pla110_07030 [Polystyrenella longa]|uniref:Leucine Rich repeats (2 copies) n=1 Tax=Polystyrenella longa TaxID=2528007 RepID=A0A518CIE9_9PLAN|nr:hypothetical protein [Polystyrenella longa]QDU78999.1 hypothetical protein Pla110_07030 [Polystyrenella longa]